MRLSPAQLARAPWATRLPHGWRFAQLSSLVDGQRSLCYGVVQPGEPVQDGVRFISAGDIRDGMVAPQLRLISPRIAQQYRRSTLQGGELLVSLVGNPGTAAIAPTSLQGANIARSVAMVPIADPVVVRWVRHYLNSPLGRSLTLAPMIGSAQQVINLRDLSTTPIPLPPDSSTPALAGLLDVFDDQFTLKSLLVREKRRRKRALVQDIFLGRRRFPEFRDNWRVMPLSDVVVPVTRRNVANVDRVLTCSGEQGLVDQTDFFSKLIASDSRDDYFLLKCGEFAYNRSAMQGYPHGAIKRLDLYPEGVLSTLNICFALRDGAWLSDFAVQVFESGLLGKQLGRITRVGSRAHGLLNVTKNDFFALEVPVPSVDEQQKISSLLDGLDREIDLHMMERDTGNVHKRTLMRQLLSGGIPTLDPAA